MQHGGNLISPLDFSLPGALLLGEGPYQYRHHALAAGETLGAAGLRALTVYVLELPAGSEVRDHASGVALAEGDCLQVEDAAVDLRVTGGRCRLLTAGTPQPSGRPKGSTRIPAKDLYRVEKPWGHELWISGDHPNYCLKQIFIKSGNRTSLQYHRQKQETNVLVGGTARLHFRRDESVPVDDVLPEHVGTADFQPCTAIDVHPGTLHRLEAVTDILLYEVSTPHLDDVVRVQDDSGRAHGRIAGEHKVA